MMPPRPWLMGIVNATPDSFSDGGRSFEATVRHALQLLEDGADILDIGGESTRPGAGEVPVAEELDRVMPVLTELKKWRPDCRISVDTRKSKVAEAALAAGAEIVNDVSGLAFDPDMAAVAAKFGAVIILGHTRGTPQEMVSRCNYRMLIRDVTDELKRTAGMAAEAGILPEKLWFDPGIGFAKTAEQSWELLRHLEELAELGPLVIGHSRKSFLGYPAGADRECATAAVTMYLRMQKVLAVRVHDVRSARIMFDVAEKLAAAGE
ncbi:MAG: dihydropteroate synthase [Lentisphaeria bacterium]|nr:dihydropteroate synthase [Lentisphaeria bacterium]